MVSIVRYDRTDSSIQRAIELCCGFAELRKDSTVLIKPNGVGSDPAIPYFGMMTTKTVVEEIVKLLLDFGCASKNISIGEGAAASRELGLSTRLFLRAMGMDAISRKYGIKIIDFNESPKRIVECFGNSYEIAAPALDTDFLINVPVPKYHEQTTVSLSLKNLKGCLSVDSKRKCHNVRLEDNIAEFNTAIPCNLTVMDGIYFLRNGGPFIDSGVPCRKDLIMAGTDRIEVDSAGCRVIGVDPHKVKHISGFAKLTGREFDVGKVQWAGDGPEQFFEAPYSGGEELFYNSFKNSKVKGIKMQFPGQTWCTGCNITLRASVYLLCKDNPGHDFGGVEIIAGKQTKSAGDYAKTILFGDCPVKTNGKNDGILQRLELHGCPPTFMNSYPKILKFVLPRAEANKQLMKNLSLGFLTRLGITRIQFPFLSGLPADVFDPRDFGRRK